jgi:hypothetical protein
MILITETWLKAHHLSSAIVNSSDYIIFRGDRAIKIGGGTAIIIRKRLASKTVQVFVEEQDCFEMVVVDYFHSRKYFSRFACVYFPPLSSNNTILTSNLENRQNSNSILLTTKLVKSLTKLIPQQKQQFDLFILGDFNFSDIDWRNRDSQRNQGSFQVFSDFMNKNNLHQLITTATHHHGNTLDLVLTSDPMKVIDILIGEPFSPKCDHYTIHLKVNISLDNSFPKPSYYNFYKADYEMINQFLCIQPWDILFESKTDINCMYSKFTSIVNEAIVSFIPKKTFTKRSKLPKNLKHLLAEKKKVYSKMKYDRSLKEKYKSLQKSYKTAVKEHIKSHEDKISKSCNKNLFHSYIKKKLKPPSYLPPLLTADGTILLDPQEKANALNSLFSSIFTHETSLNTPNLTPWKSEFDSMAPLTITREDIVDAICSLKNTVSRTPDEIPSLFFKKTANAISVPLHAIFTLSLNTGMVPDIWKQALIVPIFKKGRRNSLGNYRPLSLTSVACRIEEKIIHKGISNHLVENNLLTTCQHGFISKRSTLTQQLTFFDVLTRYQSSKTSCHAIYLDFTKAFDKIPHNKLLHVLSHFKINHQILNWTRNFLHNRSQQTVIDSYHSTRCSVTSGVPQGSVLGPLFFVLYIDSLLNLIRLNCPNIHTFAFADDVKLLSNNISELQEALKVVELWSETWKLSIQPNKSEHVPFLFSKLSTDNHRFFINNKLIPTTNSVRDLGITLSSNLKWTPHISNITSKANIISYNIIRSFSTSNILLFSNLYKTYIRPILEYNTVIWTPHLIGDINRVENIQRKFTRLACQKLNLTFSCYQDRLKLMNIETLEIRRVKFDLIYMYKILNNLVDISFQKHFKSHIASNYYNLRGHNIKLEQPPYSGSSVRDTFFCERVISLWNSLPQKMVKSTNLISFRTELDKFDINTIFVSKIRR